MATLVEDVPEVVAERVAGREAADALLAIVKCGSNEKSHAKVNRLNTI